MINIDTQKIRIIEQLARLDDITLLEEIESLLNSKTIGYHPNGQSMTQEELTERATASEEAIKKGNIISLSDLENEASHW